MMILVGMKEGIMNYLVQFDNPLDIFMEFLKRLKRQDIHAPFGLYNNENH